MCKIIGFGQIGSVIGACLADKGHQISAIDNDDKKISHFEKYGFYSDEPNLTNLIEKNKEHITYTNDYGILATVDICILTIGTPLKADMTPDLQGLFDSSKLLKKHINNEALIVYKSTVTPGTTRQIASEIFGKNTKYKISYSPERLAEGSAISDFKSTPIIIGALNPVDANLFKAFWKDIGLEVISVSSPEVAELTKLCDNIWIDLNIALANELAILSDKAQLNLDILEVISAANSLKKGASTVNILTPSFGVGGYCLPKDPWFLASFAKRNGIEMSTPKVARKINNTTPKYWAKKIHTQIQSVFSSKNELKVAVLGFAFKSNTGDCRNTPVKVFIDELKLLGSYEMVIFDPLVDENTLSEFNLQKSENLSEVLTDAHVVAFMCGHEQFYSITAREISILVCRDAIVFDGRMYFDHRKISEFRDNGLTYIGIGRGGIS